MAALRRWKVVSSYCLRHHALQTQDPEAHVVELSGLLLPKNYLSWFQKSPHMLEKEGSHQQSYLAMTPMKHNGPHDMITPRI